MRHNFPKCLTVLFFLIVNMSTSGMYLRLDPVVYRRRRNPHPKVMPTGCSSTLYRNLYPYHPDFRLHLSQYDDPNSSNDARFVDDWSADASSSFLEQHVVASAQAQMDISRVLKSIYEEEEEERKNDLLYESERRRPPVSQRQVATAAAVVVGATVFVLSSHSIFITIITSVGVWSSALLDADSLSGALARIVGRSTLRSVQQSQPKLKAVARAVLTDDLEKLRVLECRVQELEAENRALRTWKETRLQVEAVLPRYSLAELKETAKFHGLSVGGSKMDLLWRLVEAKKVILD
jgi:hypothetical protein